MEKKCGRAKKKFEGAGSMKRITVIVNPENKKALESIFDEYEVGGVTISNVQGYGNQKGITAKFRGADMKINYIGKLQAEIVVPDDKVESIIEDILDEIQTGKIGDGKIFISEMIDVVRIRTGERGDAAL